MKINIGKFYQGISFIFVAYIKICQKSKNYQEQERKSLPML
jgi:hypothetical protein